MRDLDMESLGVQDDIGDEVSLNRHIHNYISEGWKQDENSDPIKEVS